VVERAVRNRGPPQVSERAAQEPQVPLETHATFTKAQAQGPQTPSRGSTGFGDFESLKEQAIANFIELHYLDESGFAPTLPQGYTWAREGVRAIVPYQAPEGRRVNVIGSLAPFGDNPRLEYASRTTSFKGQDVLEFIWREVGKMTAPVGEVPMGFERANRCVVVLDNYSPHHGKEIKECSGALEAAGIELFYLPPYSPELNLIEPMWRHVKHEDMPVRSHNTADELKVAVDTALDKRAVALRLHPTRPTVDTSIVPAIVLARAHNEYCLSEAA
jgi:DDE superfamily endonuclease